MIQLTSYPWHNQSYQGNLHNPNPLVNPYGSYQSQTQTPAAWQYATGASGVNPGTYGGGSGGGSGGGNQTQGMDSYILSALLGYGSNAPAMPQGADIGSYLSQLQMPNLPGTDAGAFYGLNMPGLPSPGGTTGQSLDMPELPSPSGLSMPGDLSMPSVSYGPSLSAPSLPNYGMGGQLRRDDSLAPLSNPGYLPPMPTLTNPTLMAPGTVDSPTLAPGVSLSEMANATLPYQATDFNSLFGSSPAVSQMRQDYTSAFGGGQGGSGGGGYGSSAPFSGGYGNMAIQGGISAAGVPSSPQLGGLPQIQGMDPRTASAMQSNYQSAAPGMQTGLNTQYAQDAASYLNQLQGAQAQSGLNWGGVGQQAQHIRQQGQLGNQQNMLGFLSGMAL